MLKSPTILIVDDEPRICESLTALLNTRGYEITTANDAQAALALIDEKPFDLAILDVHLPDMMGPDLMDAVKKKHPDTSVIVISGDADLDSALAALRNDAYDYIRKPFEFAELLNTVENALNEQALKREKDKINRKLMRSEERYRYLVENSPDIIYTLDANGNFTFLSEALEHLLGFTVEDLIGKHYSTIVWEADRSKAQCFFDERRSRDRAASAIELRLKAVDGEQQNDSARRYLNVELKSMGIYDAPTPDGERRHIGTHGVIRDISERQRLQRQLQNSERMESLGTLAGGIAHDFNNLLMGIQGRSSLIAMDIENSHSVMEHLCSIDDYIHSATHLTKQLLGLAHGGKYEVKPTDINALILRSADMFKRTRKEIVIETQFHDTNIVVEADRRQIEQVMLNLYINAWQAMPNGGRLRIETKATMINDEAGRPYGIKPGRYVHIAVTDTGNGMDPQTLKRIFDPFFTTKEKGRGTGLGLASAYGIIKNHHGFIKATSKPGHGTTFSIYLPVSDHAVVNDDSSEETICRGHETVLLVDDEPMIIEIGEALLTKLGYRVVTAGNGEEAVKLFQRNDAAIDLVILDMIMPGMDGSQVFKHIREICPTVPVLLSSGYALSGKAEQIMKSGCNGFIQKPFKVSELSQKIRHTLETGSIPA
jgi:two-component system cell cycle sensor histidine kinase/response regulator CckA